MSIVFVLVFGEFAIQQGLVFAIIGPINLCRTLLRSHLTEKSQVNIPLSPPPFHFECLSIFSGFIRTAQALEIVSLVFYIEAAAFILVGILNFRAFSYKRSFIVAIVLLFLCSKFR